MIFVSTNLGRTQQEWEGYRQRLRPAIRSAVLQEAHLARSMMVRGIDAQAPAGHAFRPLAPMTLALRRLPTHGAKSQRMKRGTSKALIVSGDLRNSISVQKVEGDALSVSVGVHRGTRGKTGRDVQNIAAIHEYGTRAYTITVTPRMWAFSKFLVVMGVLERPWPVGTKLRNRIPARPFVRPVHELWEREAPVRFHRRLAIAVFAGGARVAAQAVQGPALPASPVSTPIINVGGD